MTSPTPDLTHDSASGVDDAAEAPPALLIVDDEPGILRAIKRELRAQEYPVICATSGSEALDILAREHIGVAISDYKMPEMDGVALLTRVKERWPNIQRIMLTGETDDTAVLEVIDRSQVFRFVAKPWDPRALRLTIAASFEQYRLLKENQRLWRLYERQNRELKEMNRGLEAKIAARTAQLARAKSEWEQTFDAIVDPLAIVRGDHRVMRANLAYSAHAARPIRDVPGKLCYEMIAGRTEPCEGCPLQRAIVGETSRGVDVLGRNGRSLHVWAFPLRATRVARTASESGTTALTELLAAESEPTQDILTTVAAVCYYRDVTEERTLESKLARTEKLASLGLFVGGVAHEINNPLGGILAFTQLLLRSSTHDEELVKNLSEIERSALRAKRIIESLLSFAHGSQHLSQEAVDCETLVGEAVSTFNKDYGTSGRVRVEVAVQNDTPRIQGDPALLHQLLRNLLQNAENAMPVRGGEIRISARSTVWQRGTHRIRAVRLEVQDNGSGIPEAHLSRIFDPFFTTKDEKKGTGLGLSICHRIVEQHGGLIEVQSTVGRGTTFSIVLPAASVSGGPARRDEDL
jgi:two-component system NtrC family sensor kinase